MLALRCWTLTALLLLAPRSLAQIGTDPQAQPAVQPPDPESIGTEEMHVLAALHYSNQTNIDAGGLALSRAQSRKVKQYGEQLIKDHQQADGILRSYARRAGVEIPTPPLPRSDAELQDAQREESAMQRLRDLEGSQFDQAFLNSVVNGSQADLQMVRNARSQIGDPQLRALLKNLLPVLQQHVSLGQKLRRDVFASPSKGR